MHQLLVTANIPSSLILVALMMEALVRPKCRFLQEPLDVTFQKTVFLIVTALKILSIIGTIYIRFKIDLIPYFNF
jgi:hypothetical protein